MKRTTPLLFAAMLLLTIFNACSTDVDLYSDYKDITVVYGLLDVSQDTNFVKINKAFLGPGNALVIAQNPDSNNYQQKLDAILIERINGVEKRRIPLDTITINDKEPGVFYAPRQLVYYTDANLNANAVYELFINKNSDEDDISSKTDIVGGESFMVATNSMNFSSMANSGALKWYKASNAAVYEVVIKFYYTETKPGQATTNECMTWSLGTYSAESLTPEGTAAYTLAYKPELFFPNLRANLGADSTLLNTVRVMGDLEVSIAAGGTELYYFIQANSSSSSIVQNIPDYTNVINGYGVFSSRNSTSKIVKMTAQTKIELQQKGWGFVQQ